MLLVWKDYCSVLIKELYKRKCDRTITLRPMAGREDFKLPIRLSALYLATNRLTDRENTGNHRNGYANRTVV